MEQIHYSALDCNDFTKHLLSKAPNLYCYNMFDKDSAPLYVPQKKRILFPCIFLDIEDHEIAHMVEMNNLNRLLIPDWGFKNWALVSPPSKRSFFAGLSREIRVRAISTIIRNESNSEAFSSTRWNIFNNPAWLSKSLAYLPFGKFKNAEELKQWSNVLVERTRSHWNKDRIEFEWIKRIEFISNWMETAQAA